MRGAGRYGLLIAAAAFLAIGACTKKEPCRPGTVYVRVDFGALAGEVTGLEVRTSLAASDSWTTETLRGLGTRDSASLEIGFSRRYPEGGTLYLSIAAIGAGGPLGDAVEEMRPLDPGCTVVSVSLDRAEGGAGGTGGGGGGGLGGAGATGGAGGGTGGGTGGGAGAGAGGVGATGGGGSGGGGTGGGAGGQDGGAAGSTGAAGAGGSGDVSACPGKPRSHWAEWKMPNPPSSGLSNPHDYGVASINGQGVVCDRVTGLMWHRPEPGGYVRRVWQEANDYCTDLMWAGFTDWRLPTRVELFSIVDYSRQFGTQSLDPAIFPGTPPEYFWTFSQDYTVPGAYWYIDFGGGLSQVDFASQTSPLHWVRCVR